MAKLKRNIIQLIEDPKATEIKLQTFLTPHFIPFSMVYESIDLIDDIENEEVKMKPKEMADKLMDMVVRIYDNQFTIQDLKERLHAPDGMRALQEQVVFITQGQQTEETRNFIQNMK
ncbi:TPA: hypothetical protein P1U96_002379 [Staphylococcus aureus]|uniref:phage tail assembly chaperone G n=1 Tax=Staphylococcus aureus TaxID=1280 RepID=UPI001E2C5655|nr:hypothetical protein [Staphylococcus aureus]UFA53862.1 hypothetical protein LB316_01635 [Staphylococcus aureus]UFA56489.1 hypothetical protein LB315_01625 [Staphylococcus aureus]HDD7339305.1 hypothetical protein [Staphylococcus aureus]HDN3443949.1 hypothetical protein [Staphylococcus aureus]HDN3492055.1 hypothetical protein [Staphylococcus aureus]